MVTVLVKDKKTRDQVRLYLKNNNVITKPTFYQVHRIPPFYSEKGINLPGSPNLTKCNVKYICNLIAKAIK